jgi:hypothetical protein
VWALVRIGEHGVQGAGDRARALGVGEDRIAQVVDELRTDGLIDGDGPTARGTAYADQLVEARRQLLSETLDDPEAERRPEVDALLRALSRELVGQRP